MAEGTNLYETVFILSTKLGEEGSKELAEKFKALIERHGTVESVDDWGKRRLAYPINKENDGYYTLINFSSTPDFTAELDRRYQINDGVIRSLIIKRDPRHVAAEKSRKAQAEKAQAERAAQLQAQKAEEKSIDVEAVAAEAVEAMVAPEQTAESAE